ncbi:hypothetical protein EDB19DRAFT_1832439 [Suillus lakei]|nr:hypothetical protein EDB19DRAFT_1832439 [Suillus lakei]
MTGHTTKCLSDDDLSSCNGKRIRRGSHSDDGTAEDTEECIPPDSEYTTGLQAKINKLEHDVEDLIMQKENGEASRARYCNQISDLQAAVHHQQQHLLDITEHARRLEEETNAQKMRIKELINCRMHDDIRRAELIQEVKEKISEVL